MNWIVDAFALVLVTSMSPLGVVWAVKRGCLDILDAATSGRSPSRFFQMPERHSLPADAVIAAFVQEFFVPVPVRSVLRACTQCALVTCSVPCGTLVVVLPLSLTLESPASRMAL